MLIMQSSEDYQINSRLKTSPPSSSRILDIPCKVCGDYSSGKHYNIFACDGCAGFFKRSIRRNRQYVCKAKEEGNCVVTKLQRNQCRACRLAKCQAAGMNKDAVQHERGPRNSTLRRQQLTTRLFTDPREGVLLSSTSPVLDLAMSKSGAVPSPLSALSMIPPFMWNPSIPRVPFTIPLPSPIPSPLSNPPAICESAARLLFMNVKWVRSIPSLTALPQTDQMLLLEESWRELFILGASQFLFPLELNSLIHASGILDDSEKRSTYMQEIKEFQETLTKLNQFQIDLHEFACLRAIVLFKTSFDRPGNISSASSSSSTETRTLSDVAAVTLVQDHTQLTLNKYITTAHPGQPLRFGKLLMLLPSLRSVSGETIEELFFRKTIGHIPIERIICDMYRSAGSEVD